MTLPTHNRPYSRDEDRHRMAHFQALDCEQQMQAIGRLAVTGMTAYGISHATGLAVEQVRRVLTNWQEVA